MVVTGIGVISASGVGHEPLWEMALRGRSAVRYLSRFSHNGSPVRVGGEVPDFRPADYIKERKGLKVMSRDIQMAVAASHLAVQDAGIDFSAVDRFRAGVTLAAGLINNDVEELGVGIRASLDETGRFEMPRFGREGIRAMFPLWLLKYLPNMPACHLTLVHGLKGPNNTIMTSSAGGLQALGEAARVIEREDAEVMLAGATDSKLNPVGLSRLFLLGILSKEEGEPAQAYRPFDRNRCGMVVGEGAGIFVLEEREHALKRGARIYGEILGYGTYFETQERSMKRALEEAQKDPREISFLHANGSGTPEEDRREADAVARVFNNGACRVPVTTTKPVTGHLIDAAGATEFALSLLALNRGLLPPVVNLREPDCDLNFVMEKPCALDASSFMLHAFGMGRESAALVVGR